MFDKNNIASSKTIMEKKNFFWYGYLVVYSLILLGKIIHIYYFHNIYKKEYFL